jgi:hypothetical protein
MAKREKPPHLAIADAVAAHQQAHDRVAQHLVQGQFTVPGHG